MRSGARSCCRRAAGGGDNRVWPRIARWNPRRPAAEAGARRRTWMCRPRRPSARERRRRPRSRRLSGDRTGRCRPARTDPRHGGPGLQATPSASTTGAADTVFERRRLRPAPPSSVPFPREPVWPSCQAQWSRYRPRQPPGEQRERTGERTHSTKPPTSATTVWWRRRPASRHMTKAQWRAARSIPTSRWSVPQCPCHAELPVQYFARVPAVAAHPS
jgi:hypothetical protein